MNASVRLVDLAVLVRYEAASDAPVFQSEGSLALERCSFRALGPTAGSRLVLAEGRSVAVAGCLFQGFDCPLEIDPLPRMTTDLKQSIFLSAAGGDEATGRAIRVRSSLGSDGSCKLKVANCSARAGVFLEAANFRDAASIALDVSGSAILVKALVEADELTKVGPGAAIRWSGNGNRYQISAPGGTWATLPGGEKLPDGPVDFDAWTKIAAEFGSQSTPLKLAKDPPDPTKAADCALLNDAGKPVGADPAMVGPR